MSLSQALPQPKSFQRNTFCVSMSHRISTWYHKTHTKINEVCGASNRIYSEDLMYFVGMFGLNQWIEMQLSLLAAGETGTRLYWPALFTTLKRLHCCSCFLTRVASVKYHEHFINLWSVQFCWVNDIFLVLELCLKCDSRFWFCQS